MKYISTYKHLTSIIIWIPFIAFGQWQESPEEELWLLGLNAGLTYQSSDIPDLLTGWGGGVSLGKTLYQKDETPLAFDIRGRLLFAKTYGQDHIPFKDIQNNEALNGTRESPPSVDYSEGQLLFTNYKTTLAEIGMEGVIRFNNLREKHQIHLGLFGGIGLDWYKTKMDQLDGHSTYDYDSWSINYKNRKTVLADIQKHLDGDYETMAAGFGNNFGRIGLMPSLGLELGYYFTPGFALIGGHRVSFSGTDRLDGIQFTPDNDKYHYTSLGFQWTIKKKKRDLLPPSIEVLYPENAIATVTQPHVSLIANIFRVKSRQDVQLYINGDPQNDFQFTNNKLQTKLYVKPGRNDVIIIATNESGTERYRQTVIFKDYPIGRAPTIRFIHPIKEHNSFDKEDIQVQILTEYVKKRSGIKVWNNEREISQIDFDPATGKIKVRTTLDPGENLVRAVVDNEYGSSEDRIIVQYVPKEQPVHIEWNHPDETYSETDKEKIHISTVLHGVKYREDIQFFVNARKIQSYSFNPENGLLNAKVSLKIRENEVFLTAHNEFYKDSDDRIIFRQSKEPPLPKPTAKILAISRIDQTHQLKIKGRVIHVQASDQIQLLVNDKKCLLDFNRGKNEVTAIAEAETGKNEIILRVWNEEGESRDIDYFVLPKLMPIPAIELISPASTPVYLPTHQYEMAAKIHHIISRNQIQVTTNARPTTEFIFDPSTGELQMNLTLWKGKNQIIIEADNASGKISETLVLIVENESFATPSFLKITQPRSLYTHTHKQVITVIALSGGISNKKDIQIRLNKMIVHQFDYNPNNGQITTTIELDKGNNHFQINAPKQVLYAERYITCNPAQIAPKITITKPKNSDIVHAPKISVHALVSGIQRKELIQVYHNQKRIIGFTLKNGGQLTAHVLLHEGKNTVKVSVSNSAGSAVDSCNIFFQKHEQLSNVAPKIKRFQVSEPTVSPYNPDEARVRVMAFITNTPDKSDIMLSINGKTVKSIQYDQGALEAVISLNKGKNTLQLSVSHRDGSDMKKHIIHLAGDKQKTKDSRTPKNNGVKRHI